MIEDLEKIEGIEKYNVIHTREGGGDEFDKLKYLKYVLFFMILINELKNEIDYLKGKI